jgi:hypothetical protein
MSISRFPVQSFVIALVSVFALPAYAEPLNDAINTEQAINNAAIRSQKTINKLSNKTQKMLERYRSASHQTETLITYNKHLKDLLHSQETEKASLEQQLVDIESTQREIVPLILRMLDNLDQFISLDLPFLPVERKQRLTKLAFFTCRTKTTFDQTESNDG